VYHNKPVKFIDNVPKAELHLHIEGTLEPELMLRLANKNNVPLKYARVEDIREAYKFENLQSFLEIYYAGMKTLQSEEDFYELTVAYLKKAKSENVVHAELFFDPQAHLHRGIKFSTVIEGILRAIDEANKSMNISAELILSFLRHLPEEDAIHTFQEATPYRDRIIAVGLDSSELGNPPAKFKHVFEMARDEGFLAVAHAGEEGPPEYIWEAIKELKVRRIDHGVRATEDVALLQTLANKKIPLTMCPLSNQKLNVVSDLGEYPLRKFLDRNIIATINSDDPAYFGGYINENYKAIQKSLNLTIDDIMVIAKNSVMASFITEEKKREYIEEIDKVYNMFAEVQKA